MTGQRVVSAFLCSYVVSLLPRSESDTQPSRSAAAASNVRHEFLTGIAGEGDDSVDAAIEGN
jgi:hypothetical protein